MIKPICKSAGFTLIELSIVIIIIALLVAGVMSGKSLIQSGNIRAVVTEHDQFQAAVSLFYDQYAQLPGDMANAWNFWSNCGGSKSACNGDGDGVIEWGAAGNANEWAMAWRHLELASLLGVSNLTGMGADNTTTGVMTIGTNIPDSKITRAGWSMFRDNNAPEYRLDNHLVLGGTGATDGRNLFPALSPKLSHGTDIKLDDGLPSSGDIIVRPINTLIDDNCRTIGPPGNYTLEGAYVDEAKCVLYFQIRVTARPRFCKGTNCR